MYKKDGHRFFASLSLEALAIYPPAAMLDALLLHEASPDDVQRPPGDPQSRRKTQPRRPPRVVESDGDGPPDEPPVADQDSVEQPPRAESGAGQPPKDGDVDRNELSSMRLSSRLQDALLQSVGVIDEELRMTGVDGMQKPVLRGRAIYHRYRKKSLVVWAARASSSVVCYCSCGGDSLQENVSARVMTQQSSTCGHAGAHAQALRAAAAHLRYASPVELLQKHPTLDNSKAVASQAIAVKVEEEEDGRRTHVVGYNGIWSVVLTASLRARRSRPVCTHVPCRTRSSFCVHSCSVKPPLGGFGTVDGGAAGDEADEGDGVDDETNGGDQLGDGALATVVRPPERPAAPNARKKGQQRKFIDTDHTRRARNMLPCAIETGACRRWDKFARGEAVPDASELDLFEAVCPTCGAFTAHLSASVSASLHTLSGVLTVRTSKRKCSELSCGMEVDFDGSWQGLFSYSEKTVYTRTFLDVILFTIFSTKSSISAASAVSAFYLHCTGAVHEYDTVQSRQELSKATDQYSRTLIVPRALFQCVKCYNASSQPYLAIVADGQTIGIFRDNSFPFERDTANVPTIPVSIDNACAVPVAKVRKCVRQRLKAGFSEQVTFASADQVAMSKFALTGGVAPPLGDHSSAAHRAKCAHWAASCFFHSFFVVTDVPREPLREEDAVVAPAELPPASPAPSPSAFGLPPLSRTPPRLLQAEGSGAARPYPMAGTSQRPSPAGLADGSSNAGDAALRGGGDKSAGAEPLGHPAMGAKYCNTSVAAIGSEQLQPVVKRERWAIIYDFCCTFLAEPLIGIFSGCAVDQITSLAMALVNGKEKHEWMPLSSCVHSLHVVWPALEMLSDDLGEDEELCRAFGELLMFALHTDNHMEDLWRSRMNVDSLRFEAGWTNTDAAKFRAWKSRQPVAAQLPSGLKSGTESIGRAADQAGEVRTGIVFPSLEQVRQHPRDDVAAAVARANREKSKTGRQPSAKRKRSEMVDGGLGDDDCRHAFVSHSAFTPGVVSYLCSCGILIGFEVLESAESPAGIVATLASRFPRLPGTVYYDTACQASRNATRRVPWLVRLSKTSWALDRFHAPPHKCSPIFDANNYPQRSGLHKTSAAENRHSLNKPLKSHLTYLAQDRFVVQMRLIGAVNNLLIFYRRFLGVSDVRHRPLPSFYHRRIVSHCELLGCVCRATP